jgi:hypothetical protein
VTLYRAWTVDRPEMRTFGDDQVRRDMPAETRIAARTGMRGRWLREGLCPAAAARSRDFATTA